MREILTISKLNDFRVLIIDKSGKEHTQSLSYYVKQLYVVPQKHYNKYEIESLNGEKRWVIDKFNFDEI